jgi:hypothetical protein
VLLRVPGGFLEEVGRHALVARVEEQRVEVGLVVGDEPDEQDPGLEGGVEGVEDRMRQPLGLRPEAGLMAPVRGDDLAQMRLPETKR